MTNMNQIKDTTGKFGKDGKTISWRVGNSDTDFTYEYSISRAQWGLFRWNHYEDDKFVWVGRYDTLEGAQKASLYRV